MTAKEHLAEADRLLAEVGRTNSPWPAEWVLARAMQAQGHALAAIAIELGAPHTTTTGEVTSDTTPAGTTGG